MKKITLFALAALSLTLASCNKEQIQPAPENGNTITMTLNASVEQTKATISDEWKFAFTEGDNISLTNNQATDYSTVTRGSDGKFTGTVTAPQSAATWYAYYPSNNVSFANQTGTQAGTAAYYAYSGKQENVAAGTKNLDITLNPQTAILVITSYRASLDINVKTSDGKWVSGLTAKSGDAKFDVTKSDTKVSLFSTTAKGTYYVVVPAGVKIAIFDGDLKVKETKDDGLTAGNYYNITVEDRTIADVLATVDGGFPGGDSNKKPSGNAWVYGSNRYAFVYSSFLMIYNSIKDIAAAKGVPLDTPVTPGENCYTVTSSSKNITLTFNMTAGKLTSINFSSPDASLQEDYGGTYTPSPGLPDGALSGVFTVSNDGGTTKTQIYFSKGNLWYGPKTTEASSTFNFETNQYDFTPNINGYWDESHISNFYWSQTASSAYAKEYDESDSDVLFTNATETTPKADFTVNGMTNFWRTLSQEEWQYLLETRKMTYEMKRYSNAMKYGVTIGTETYKGIFLYPDNYNGNEVSGSMTWAQINAAGIVFLPSTGYRSEESIYEVSGTTISCIYWTSTVAPDDDDYYKMAYRMFFKWDKSENPELVTEFEKDGRREWAAGIRLVTDIK